MIAVQNDVYGSLASASAAALAIGVDAPTGNPGDPAAGTGLVVVQQGSVAAGTTLPADNQAGVLTSAGFDVKAAGIGSEYVGAPGVIPGLSPADLQKQADDQIKAGRLPKVTDLAARIAALPDIEGNQPIKQRLNQALFILMSLDRAKGKVIAASSEQDKLSAAQLVRELTDEAKRLLGIEIGGLRFGRITGALDPATGTLTATVNDAVLTKLAGPDFAIDELAGSLELRLGADGVSARPDQLKDVDPVKLAGQLTPGLGLKNVTAKGIHLAQGTIAQATIGHLTGTLKATETGFEIPDLAVDRLEIDGIAVGTPGAGIAGETVILQQLAMDIALETAKTSTGTKLTRALIKSMSIGSLGGDLQPALRTRADLGAESRAAEVEAGGTGEERSGDQGNARQPGDTQARRRP